MLFPISLLSVPTVTCVKTESLYCYVTIVICVTIYKTPMCIKSLSLNKSGLDSTLILTYHSIHVEETKITVSLNKGRVEVGQSASLCWCKAPSWAQDQI